MQLREIFPVQIDFRVQETIYTSHDFNPSHYVSVDCTHIMSHLSLIIESFRASSGMMARVKKELL